MYAEERQAKILAALERDGRVAVSELAASFDVATETIRRDLDSLAQRDVLVRVHGGAIARRTSDLEPDLPTRLSTNTASKMRIGAAAAHYLPPPGSAVLIDAGSTTTELIPHLEGGNLRVITNSLPLAQAALGQQDTLVDILPGHLRPLTQAAVGTDTVQALAKIHPDVAFIGCNGISADGLTTPDPDEAAVKAQMVAQAATRVLLADSSKVGVRQLVTFARLDDIDVVVSDAAMTDSFVHQLQQAGIEVLRA